MEGWKWHAFVGAFDPAAVVDQFHLAHIGLAGLQHGLGHGGRPPAGIDPHFEAVRVGGQQRFLSGTEHIGIALGIFGINGEEAIIVGMGGLDVLQVAGGIDHPAPIPSGDGQPMRPILQPGALGTDGGQLSSQRQGADARQQQAPQGQGACLSPHALSMAGVLREGAPGLAFPRAPASAALH